MNQACWLKNENESRNLELYIVWNLIGLGISSPKISRRIKHLRVSSVEYS